jgi:hypothetical protein
MKEVRCEKSIVNVKTTIHASPVVNALTRSLVLVIVLVTGCSVPTTEMARSRGASNAFASPPTDRPGLGTKWGETRTSRISIASFDRADSTRPIAAAAIYYNDAEGIRAMTGAAVWDRTWPVLPSPVNSLVQVALKDQSGRLLPGVIVGDRWFVIGEEGRRYSILVRNRSDWRLEAVLSVDGLDVLDGSKASLGKRGYILKPHGQLLVDGFRQGMDAVAAFRFGPVRESYANEKYHQTRNVGVIGIAIFNERGANVPSSREVQKRLDANPFPGGFATPPGR